MKSQCLIFATAVFIALPNFFLRYQVSNTFTSSDTAQSQREQSENQNDRDKSEKDGKKKKKDKSSAFDLGASATFSDSVAHDVLQQLVAGLEGHDERLMLSAFDDNKMVGYLNFEDQVLAFFQLYDSFRVHFRISQASMEGNRGIALVDIEMEEIPRSPSLQPVRKSDQIRFEMERGKKGWKIADLRPRAFFS